MLEHYGTASGRPDSFPSRQDHRGSNCGEITSLASRSAGCHEEVHRTRTIGRQASRVEQWERKHGRILEGSIVLLRTGWGFAVAGCAEVSKSSDAQGKMHFPGLGGGKILISRIRPPRSPSCPKQHNRAFQNPPCFLSHVRRVRLAPDSPRPVRLPRGHPALRLGQRSVSPQFDPRWSCRGGK